MILYVPGGSFVPPTLLVSLIADLPAFRDLVTLALTVLPWIFLVRLTLMTTLASVLSVSFSLVARGFFVGLQDVDRLLR